MAILLKVQWIEKSDELSSYKCIQNIGGNSRELYWKHTQAQAIRSIEHGVFAYYIQNGPLLTTLQVGITPDGQKYLKTEADDDQPQHLVSLPAFPPLRDTCVS